MMACDLVTQVVDGSKFQTQETTAFEPSKNLARRISHPKLWWCRILIHTSFSSLQH
jgi:dihydroneopterin aldolase